MDKAQKEEILNLIGRISPSGRDFANEAVNNNTLTVFYYKDSADEHGVFCIAESTDCDIAYYSFPREPHIEKVKDLIATEMKPYFEKAGEKELCFNVYGKNVEVIEFIRSLGFKVDMEGYHLFYNRLDVGEISRRGLVERLFEDSMSEQLVDLFDNGYFQLNKENGWQTDWHYTHVGAFQTFLTDKTRGDDFRSFWIGDQLIGAFIIDDNYIRDIVVSPEYQNRGYGSEILTHCIRHMLENKNVKRVCLRIAKSNSRARKLYERQHFEEFACFAEHTFINS